MAKQKKRAPKAASAVLGAPSVAIRLDAPSGDTTPEVPAVKWIHVASEGEYLGHPQGAFEFTEEVFRSFVKNLRADVRYEPNEQGVGTKPVLQFDYEHASELDPTSGSIPQNGAPAPGWVLDLQVRQAEDGTAELWALAQLGEKIREQIAEGSYRWVSIAFVGNRLDPVSGQPIGPSLTSIAFTNKPFLRDLRPLAASDRMLGPYYAAPACDVAEALNQLRRLFNLTETTDAPTVIAEVGKLAALATSGAAPSGIDVDGLLGAVRVILGLPMGTAAEEVARIASTTLSPPVAVGASENHDMTLDPKKLAKALRCRATIEEDEMIRLAEEAGAASVDLAKVLESLGVADAAAALAAIPSLMAAKAKLDDAQKQIADLLQFKQQVEQQSVETDVAAAMSAHKLPDGVKIALLNFRKSDPKLFAETYPVPEADKAKLLNQIVAGPGGTQLQVPQTLPRETRSDATDNVVNLSAYDGRNDTERAMAHLLATNKEAKKWSRDRLVTEAGKLRRSAQVQTG